MENTKELCCYYLSLLQVVSLVDRNSHWRTKGDTFYGDHLLFDRIYKSASENIDLAAEKFVGLFGNEAINPQMQAEIISKLLPEYSSGNPLEVSLKVEKKFLSFAETFYKAIEQEDKMSLGLNDALGAISSDREEAVYLLQQTLKGNDNTMDNAKLAARIKFLKKISQQNPQDMEKEAFAHLKSEISSVLTTMIKTGQPANFKVSASRTGGEYDHYVIQVVLMPGTPEASVKEGFEKMLPNILARVPYFDNKATISATISA